MTGILRTWPDGTPVSGCHCMCSLTHPDDRGICEVFTPVIFRRYITPRLGPVEVPFCAPCAAAAAARELAEDHPRRIQE